YAFEDFASRADAVTYETWSLVHTLVNECFAQKRYMNDSFAYTDPIDCSERDTNTSRACSLQANNDNGFYKSSPWEYSWIPLHQQLHMSVDRVRDVVFTNFNTSGHGRSVPSTPQIPILSPFIPSYTIHSSYLNANTTVTVEGYDANSVRQVIPAGAAAYAQNVTVNGVPTASRCHFDFYDTFKIGGNITISVTSNKTLVNDCAGPVPESISTGGFAVPR
ncbi:glycoside hydrolase family 92 protein, partial [Athelia psychrophila]